jgi:hypothetical protein
MEAENQFPSYTLRLIGSDFANPMMRAVVEDLWQGLRTEYPIHRHIAPPKMEWDKRDEVWIFASYPVEWQATLAQPKKVSGCAALFLHERSSERPLPDLRWFAAADWIFAPWGQGELVSRIQALTMRLQKKPAQTDNAFFNAGSESSHVPMQKAKSEAVSAFERGYLLSLMRNHFGNVSAAARSARKHRRAFLALLQKHSIKPNDFRETKQSAEWIR